MHGTTWLGVALLALPGCGGNDDDKGDADTDGVDTDLPDTDDTDPPTCTSGTDLASLDVGGALTPAFDPAIRIYAVRASGLADPIALDAVPSDPCATVTSRLETVDGADVAGELSPNVDHRVVITVTGTDGATSDTVVGLLADDFPELVVSRPGTPAPGWYLLSSFTFGAPEPGVLNYLMILDDRGTPTWWRKATGSPVFDLRVSPGGRLTYGGSTQPTAPKGTVLDASYAIESTFDALDDPDFDSLEIDIHEFILEPDGDGIVLALAQRAEDITTWGGEVDSTVLHSVAQELSPAEALVFDWDSVAVEDYDTSLILADPRNGWWESAHVNSLQVDPADGHWVLSLRIPSEVLKIARHADGAFAAGDVMWRLGGVHSDFTFVGDARGGFTGQHSAKMTGPDTVMVFDNAAVIPPAVGSARFVEYRLDTSAWTATQIAQYEDPNGLYSSAGGSVQRLENGGTLIGWGGINLPAVDLTELDAQGNVAFELSFPGTLWSYRAWKAEGDPFTGTWLPTDP